MLQVKDVVKVIATPKYIATNKPNGVSADVDLNGRRGNVAEIWDNFDCRCIKVEFTQVLVHSQLSHSWIPESCLEKIS